MMSGEVDEMSEFQMEVANGQTNKKQEKKEL